MCDIVIVCDCVMCDVFVTVSCVATDFEYYAVSIAKCP